MENPEKGEEIVELVIPDNSYLENQTIKESNFLERYNASLLAIREGGELTHQKLNDVKLKAGNVLLLLVTESTLERLRKNNNFIIEEKKLETPDYNYKNMAISIGIVTSVIILGALNILPIAIATLGGVVAMVSTGMIEPQEVDKSVNWEVFFLLAGLIPLGVAVEKTGTASFIADKLLEVAGTLPPIGILILLYLINSTLAAIIGNSSSVILMIPVAVGIAQQIGANPFSFLLTVTFASSSAFATPMGYQTNLMVYGPGGYKFSDFVKVGVPLQLIMAIIVPVFVSIFWGL